MEIRSIQEKLRDFALVGSRDTLVRFRPRKLNVNETLGVEGTRVSKQREPSIADAAVQLSLF